jgi:hypothetical protein
LGGLTSIANKDVNEPGLVPIIKPLRLLLDAIRPANASCFIFPNTIGGAPDLDNLADRVIRPNTEGAQFDVEGLAGISSRSRHEAQKLNKLVIIYIMYIFIDIM